jgi:hypothetical protein
VQRAASSRVPRPAGPVGMWHAAGHKTSVVGRSGWPSPAAQAGPAALANRLGMARRAPELVTAHGGAATDDMTVVGPVPGLHG